MEITRDSSGTLVTGPIGDETAPIPPDLRERPIRLTDNARTVLQKRYLRRGEDGKPAETEHEMFWRVAYNIALAEAKHGGGQDDVLRVARRFFDLLTDLRFFPNSPTFTGAGTPLGQLAACFVMAIDDDMGRSESGIFQTLRNAALIQQTGGGNGFAFSNLRPKGAIVHSSNGQATGPVGFLRVYDQAFGEIAQGGCLTPDTLVFTSNGLLRLDELVTHDSTGWRAHTLSVATDEGPRESTQTYNNGIADVLRITTDAGLQLTGTPNHKLKVMTPAGTVWRRLDELQPGDALVVKLGQHVGTTQSLIQPVQRHGNQVMPSFPSHIDTDFAFFLGCMAGDGFVAAADNDHRIGISVAHDSYLMNEMPALMTRLFGESVTVHCVQKENDASATYIIDNRAIKDFFSLNGLTKARGNVARVPRLIRQSPPEVVGAFLRGLFETDGALSHGYPQLLSSSEVLIREVATLLIGLGCPVRMARQPMAAGHYGQTQMWLLRVNSFAGLHAWREHIGCDARSRFQVCHEYEPDLSRESSYVLPHAEYWVESVLTATALPQIDKHGRGMGKNFRATSPHLRKELLRYKRGDRQLTLSGYERLGQEYPAFAEHARPVNDQWFVTVESLEDAGQSITLDLEVEDNHTYLANGIVSHNSRRGANMAVLSVDHPDIREFITCKTDESKITNFNISVGISDAFMRACETDSTYNLINPQDGKVWETVRAREIFDLIVKQAHHNGEPGVLFLDTANKQNPVPHLYKLESTNPCVPGDTLVATPDGWKRADSMCEGDEICTLLGTGKIATIEINEAVPVLRVHLSDGGSVRATAAHQFHVRDSVTDAFEATRLDQIKVGDWIRGHGAHLVEQLVPAGAIELESQSFGLLESVTFNSNIRLIQADQDEDWAAQVISIEPDGIERVYDLYEPTSDTWITNGYVSRGCGEQFLGPFENCCLGSINLVDVVTPNGQVDWALLQQLTEDSTRFLDDVVTANKYVPAVPQLEEAAHRVRRIGLGIMGLGDLMYKLGVRYGSEEGQEFAGQVMEFVRYHTMKTSIALAQERGPFPAIKGSIYDPNNLIWQPPNPMFPYTRNWARPAIEWQQIVNGIKKFGIRNGATLTVAPTGTIATVSGCEAYGCEPVFALAYIRHVNDRGNDLQLQYTSPLFEKALHDSGLDDAQIKAIIEEVNTKGSCQDVAGIPENVRHTFVVSSDISADEHIRMQAAMQTFVDNAISKTCNFPSNATEQDVATAYMLGWKLGCKGMTVYVTGSREKVVLETHATAQTKQAESAPDLNAAVEPVALIEPDPVPFSAMHVKKERPRELFGRTFQVGTPLGKTYVTINENGDGRGHPFEIFTHTSKAGSETAAVSEAIGRLISLILRFTSPISPRERLKEIVRQLDGIGGGRSTGFGPTRVRSLPDGIAQVLQEYIDETESDAALAQATVRAHGHNNNAQAKGKSQAQIAAGAAKSTLPTSQPIGDLCPECGEPALVNEEGCRKCHSCGYSEC
ncbi:MAG: ribonucleotide reductase N-terminal alpha domain-containing protein [Aggregatilineales bacterium]